MLTAHQEMTVEEPILVAVNRLERELEIVKEACGKVHARHIAWSGDASLPGLRRKPTVLVSALRIGERRVPDEIVSLATKTFPGLSLVFLSREPLLRPVMTLQRGRITLMSPPITPTRLASTLRSIIADRRSDYASTDTATGLDGAKSLVITKRHRRSDSYVGTFACSASDGAKARPPTVRQTKTEGVTVVLPFSEDLVDVQLNAVTAAARSTNALEDVSHALSKLVGDACGVIHLDAASEEWTIYWPDPSRPVVLSSPLRLPSVWNMATKLGREERRIARLPAEHCDTLAALTGALGEGSTALADLTKEGAAYALEQLERALRERPTQVSGVVMEVL